MIVKRIHHLDVVDEAANIIVPAFLQLLCRLFCPLPSIFFQPSSGTHQGFVNLGLADDWNFGQGLPCENIGIGQTIEELGLYRRPGIFFNLMTALVIQCLIIC